MAEASRHDPDVDTGEKGERRPRVAQAVQPDPWQLISEIRTGAWRGPTEPYRLPIGTTVVVDEAGMVGTATLDRLVGLAQAQRWRLVLVGDPYQLHAVGRGGVFDELCRTGRTHELATIHRFHYPWERDASLALRAGRPEAIDAYLDHNRVSSGTFDELADEAARRWIDLNDARKRITVVAETNEHVDALNGAIQAQRRRLGHLGTRTTPIAAGDDATVGDVVVTRRNDRTPRTTSGEPIRNRDRWIVTAIGRDGIITVSHHDGHGTAPSHLSTSATTSASATPARPDSAAPSRSRCRTCALLAPADSLPRRAAGLGMGLEL